VRSSPQLGCQHCKQSATVSSELHTVRQQGLLGERPTKLAVELAGPTGTVMQDAGRPTRVGVDPALDIMLHSNEKQGVLSLIRKEAAC